MLVTDVAENCRWTAHTGGQGEAPPALAAPGTRRSAPSRARQVSCFAVFFRPLAFFSLPPFLRQGLAQTRPAPLPARTQASGGRVGIPPSLRALARQGDAESEDAESEDSTPPRPKGAREVGTVHPSARCGRASPRCLRQLPGVGVRGSSDTEGEAKVTGNGAGPRGEG